MLEPTSSNVSSSDFFCFGLFVVVLEDALVFEADCAGAGEFGWLLLPLVLFGLTNNSLNVE